MERAIVGSGDYVYEVIHPFGRLPVDMTMGNTSHVAVDSRDRVYVYRRAEPPVLVFDGDGNLLTSWGDGQLLDAHGIFITATDEVYLVDRDAHEILKFDTDGNRLMTLGIRHKPAHQEPFNHPADVAIAPNGDIFIADGYGNSRVHRFSSEGDHILSWGAPGGAPGEFTTPHGVWIDDRERVLVCDRENNRVQLFSVEGDYLGEWTDVYHPMDVFVDTRGTVFVTDQIPRLTLLNSEGERVGRMRTLFNGHGMWIDSVGNIYLAGNLPGMTKLAKV